MITPREQLLQNLLKLAHKDTGINSTSLSSIDSQNQAMDSPSPPQLDIQSEVMTPDPVRERHGAPAEPMPDLVLQIRSALARLDPESQVLLLLIDQQGYSYKEASEILGITQAAVTSRIHRVRRAFWKAYEKP